MKHIKIGFIGLGNRGYSLLKDVVLKQGELTAGVILLWMSGSIHKALI